jgi:hypothetical protein
LGKCQAGSGPLPFGVIDHGLKKYLHSSDLDAAAVAQTL